MEHLICKAIIGRSIQSDCNSFFVADRVTVDTKKVGVFLIVVRGEAYTLLQNLLAPIKPTDKSCDKTVEVIPETKSTYGRGHT